MSNSKRGSTDWEELSPDFIALLCCPLCPNRPRLQLTEDKTSLLCACGQHRFPIDPEYGFPDLRPPGERTVAPAAKE